MGRRGSQHRDGVPPGDDRRVRETEIPRRSWATILLCSPVWWSVYYDPFMATLMSESGTERGGRSPWGDVIALVWIVGYALFFFHFTLPNSNPPVSRVDVWLDLPDLLWSNVVTPPKAPSASWRNLSQRLDLFGVAVAIWLGSWAIGSLLLRVLRVPLVSCSAERQVCACGVGLSAVSLLTLGCGLGGWLSPWLLGGVLAVGFVLEGWQCLRERSAVSGQRSAANDIGPSAWKSFVGFATRGEQLPYPLLAKSLAVVAVSLFLLAMLLGSVLPPTDFDVKAYHLTGPKEYFLDGRITFLEHNVYTNFPFLTEMLCLLGMVLRQDWYRGALAGQAVLMGFAPLTGLALFCAGRRWFCGTVGWLAAVIYLTTPWTYRLAIIAYVEGALSCYLFLTLFAVLLAVEELRRERDSTAAWRLFLLAGLFAGSAMSCKYPGLVSVVLPLGVASGVAGFREGRRQKAEPESAKSATRRLKPVLLVTLVAFAVGTALAVGPWLLKNLVMTGNPVYPLAYGFFDGRDWDAASHAKWRKGHSPDSYAVFDGRERPTTPANSQSETPNDDENAESKTGSNEVVHRTLVEYFIDVTAMADWLSPLLFGLAPLALVVRVRSAQCQVPSEKSANLALSTQHLALFLWLYVAYLFFQWWLLTHRIDRFWVPLIPVVALLAAVGCEWSSSKLWRRACGVFVALSVLFNLGFVTTPLCGFNAYLSDLEKAREGSESTAEGIHYLNQLLESGKLAHDATVLCVGEAQVFDARPRMIYHTVFDQPIFRDWLAERPAGDVPDRDWPLRPIEDVRRKFESEGVTHVLVNWQEVLRYRMTYGYSDFVTPQRFAWLQERGLLGNPAEFALGLREFDSLKPEEQREVEKWAPELKWSVRGQTMFVTWQVFAVQTSRSASSQSSAR